MRFYGANILQNDTIVIQQKQKAPGRNRRPFIYVCVSRRLSGARDDIELIA